MSDILVIDDDPFVRSLIDLALAEDGHAPRHAVDATAGLAAARERSPDLVLLDIELPDGDGYSVCRELRADARTAGALVVFVSAHGGAAERLTAYDAGGDDFIVKPIDPTELRRKVALALRHRGERDSLRSQAGDAMQMAMTALSDSGGIGTVLAFFREALRARDLSGLAAALLRATAEYDLDAVVRLVAGETSLNLNSQGRSSAMEGVLLAGLADAGERIVAMGRKLVICYPHAVVLVKNAPVDDVARCGRLRDYLAMLGEGAEERANALAVEAMVRELIVCARNGLDAIDTGNRRQQSRMVAVMDVMMRELERELPGFGLTMAQENRLIDVVQQATASLNAIYDDGLAMDDAFAGLRQLLDEGRSR